MDRFTGGCVCGNVRIVASGRPYRVGLCHCLDCRKHHGALFTLRRRPASDAVTIEEGETRDYEGLGFILPTGNAGPFSPAAQTRIEVNLGSLDAPDQLMPTAAQTICRRGLGCRVPLTRRYIQDRLRSLRGIGRTTGARSRGRFTPEDRPRGSRRAIGGLWRTG